MFYFKFHSCPGSLFFVCVTRYSTPTSTLLGIFSLFLRSQFEQLLRAFNVDAYEFTLEFVEGLEGLVLVLKATACACVRCQGA